jgi:hypothetical protein
MTQKLVWERDMKHAEIYTFFLQVPADINFIKTLILDAYLCIGSWPDGTSSRKHRWRSHFTALLKMVCNTQNH